MYCHREAMRSKHRPCSRRGACGNGEETSLTASDVPRDPMKTKPVSVSTKLCLLAYWLLTTRYSPCTVICMPYARTCEQEEEEEEEQQQRSLFQPTNRITPSEGRQIILCILFDTPTVHVPALIGSSVGRNLSVSPFCAANRSVLYC